MQCGMADRSGVDGGPVFVLREMWEKTVSRHISTVWLRKGAGIPGTVEAVALAEITMLRLVTTCRPDGLLPNGAPRQAAHRRLDGLQVSVLRVLRGH